MVEVFPNILIGTIDDYEGIKGNSDYFTVIAAKEPYHRKAVGYSGRSRSACIGMMYMKRAGYFKGISFDGAEMLFRKIYPPYEPARGIREYARRNWDRF